MNWHICHKRKLLFYSYFQHISLCFYSNFRWESSLDAASNEYPHCILLMDPATPKIRNTWKNVMMTWNLSKNIGRYVENTNKKNSFFHSSSKINSYYFIILTIIFLRRPILDLKFPLKSDFSRRWKKHANPRKWRKNNGGWVGNKSSKFPSWLAFILSIEK